MQSHLNIQMEITGCTPRSWFLVDLLFYFLLIVLVALLFAFQAEECAQVGVEPDITKRQVSEVVLGAAQALATGLNYPRAIVRDAVRPAYWQADHEISNCFVCESLIAPDSIHHCRACGKGVCAACSTKRQKVPLRGWDTAVRVCDNCAAN